MQPYHPFSARCAIRGFATASTTPTFHCVTAHRRTAGPKNRWRSAAVWRLTSPVLSAKYSRRIWSSFRHSARRVELTRYRPNADPNAKAGAVDMMMLVFRYSRSVRLSVLATYRSFFQYDDLRALCGSACDLASRESRDVNRCRSSSLFASGSHGPASVQGWRTVRRCLVAQEKDSYGCGVRVFALLKTQYHDHEGISVQYTGTNSWSTRSLSAWRLRPTYSCRFRWPCLPACSYWRRIGPTKSRPSLPASPAARSAPS